MTYEPSKSNSFFIDHEGEKAEEEKMGYEIWLEGFLEQKEIEDMIASGKTCFTCKRWRTPSFFEGYADLIKHCPYENKGTITMPKGKARKNTCFNWIK